MDASELVTNEGEWVSGYQAIDGVGSPLLDLLVVLHEFLHDLLSLSEVSLSSVRDIRIRKSLLGVPTVTFLDVQTLCNLNYRLAFKPVFGQDLDNLVVVGFELSVRVIYEPLNLVLTRSEPLNDIR